MARRPFTLRRDGTVTARLPGGLRALVAGQLRALAALLDAEDGAGSTEPVDPLAALTGMADLTDRPLSDDPAIQRLRPDAYAPEVEDGRAAADYRRLAGGELAGLQRARVATVLETLEQGDRFDLSPDEAQAWLGALNDLRLVSASRLGIADDEMTGVEVSPALALYQALGQVQHALLVALGAPDDF
jgi:hypothetical protein